MEVIEISKRDETREPEQPQLPSTAIGPGVDREQTLLKIRPSKGWVALNLRDLWAYRELFYFLTWRDIKVRYKQTLLGASWAIIQPLFTMLLFLSSASWRKFPLMVCLIQSLLMPGFCRGHFFPML